MRTHARRSRPPSPAARTVRRTPAKVERCLYAYGIARAGASFRTLPSGIGLAETGTRVVVHRGLGLLVGDLPPGPLLPTRENLLGHVRVIEAAALQHTFLPLSFGTVLTGDDDAQALLQAGYDAFRRAIRRVDGQVEYAVKLLCRRDQLSRRLERDNPDLSRVMTALDASSGEGSFLRLQHGRMVDEAVEAECERVSGALLALGEDCATRLRIDRPVGELVVQSVAMLVPRSGEAAFLSRLGRLASDCAPWGEIRCTGPMAPYSFSAMRLHVGAASVRTRKRA